MKLKMLNNIMDNKSKLKELLKNKIKQEMSMTGTGASVTPGTGEGVATKYAFGKKKDGNKVAKDYIKTFGGKLAPSIPNRPSKAMDYKKIWEGELKLGVKYNYNGDSGYISTGGSQDPKNWKFLGGKQKYPYLDVKADLTPSEKQPGKYDGAFDLGMGKGHHIDEAEGLDIDDRVKVVYGNEFYGETGTIVDIKRGFVTVEMDRNGEEYSMHISDVQKIDDEYDDDILDETHNVKEIFTKADQEKAEKLLDQLKNKNLELYRAIVALVLDEYPHTGQEIDAIGKAAGLTETNTEFNINKVWDFIESRPFNNPNYMPKFNTAQEIWNDWGSKEKEMYVNFDWKDIYGDKIHPREKSALQHQKNYDALAGLNENYARFRNETKTRTKPEQFHSAVKEVKKKVNEINRLFEYMNRLQNELKESEGGLKTKKYTENALQQIKEATKKLFLNSTKLK
jgi:hypothetical protein